MFPTIGDIITYLTGVSVNISLQTFGTCMALAFTGAYFVFTAEFKRKEKEGIIRGITVKEIKGQPSSPLEMILNTAAGFLLGYKGWEVLQSIFSGADPVDALLSWQGSWPAGIVLGVVWGVWIYLYGKRTALEANEEREVPIYKLMPLIVFTVAFWGFIGAKLFDAIEHIQELRYRPMAVLFSRNGFAYYGGLIFGMMAFFHFGYKRGIKIIHLADIGSPGMMLAYGIGRIGCHLSGDGDWGVVNRYVKPSWMPEWAWAYKYPHNIIDAGIHIPGCTAQHCHELPAGVFPTPLYEAVICLLLFALMWAMRKRLKTAGLMFSCFLVLNGLERFFIEMLRITPKYDWLGSSLSQAQLVALVFLLVGIIGFVILLVRYYFYRFKHYART